MKSALLELAAELGAQHPDREDYLARYEAGIDRLPPGLVTRKLRENLANWSTLTGDERSARHFRALAILGDALRQPTTQEVTGAPSAPANLPTPPPARNDSASGSAGTADTDPFPLEEESEIPWESGSQQLAEPLQNLPGIGKKRAAALAGKELHTIGDLLSYLPYRYDNRTERRSLAGVATGSGVLVCGRVLARGPARMRRFPTAYAMEIALDAGERLRAIWFRTSRPQQEFLSRAYAVGADIEVAGQLDFFDGRHAIMHPEHGIPGSLERGLLPVYSEIDGIGSKTIRQWVSTALAQVDGIPDPLPLTIRKQFRLLGRERALREMHRPSDATANPLSNAYAPRRRLIFNEFLLLSLGLLIRRQGIRQEEAVAFPELSAPRDSLTASLPFTLTAAQTRVVNEVAHDMARGNPMYRMIQGDVGCGKTMVALLSAAGVLAAGYQVALMAPTELLAEQHARNAEAFLQPHGYRVALLTGSTGTRARKELREALSTGQPILVIGTHALIEPEVGFCRLGLAIIDEQHRFGVSQRARLTRGEENARKPHLLVMTATPIPRTLAMTLYGDLDVSMIDELPPGRTPVETKLVRSDQERRALMARVKAELAEGHQVYWVFPLIEESEKVELKDATRAAELLKQALPEVTIDLLHGRMGSTEKEAVMQRFKRGESGILVSTTVIEVGVDVPNASLMVIEHADRFGLSQLHQLRGRVGRGAARSYCFLRVDHHLGGDGAQRLQIMTETNDGFRIAEADLDIRGAGDLLGTRQSGLPSLHIADPIRDQRILGETRSAAEAVLAVDPDLSAPAHQPLREMVDSTWAGRLHLTTSG